MTKRINKQNSAPKGVLLDPKTNEEALALLRWMYGDHIPAYVPAS